VAVRLVVALVALLLAWLAARRLFGARAASASADPAHWAEVVAGSAALVGSVAVILNLVALVGALNTSSLSGIYNHIGS
jgi:hypothetical protein